MQQTPNFNSGLILFVNSWIKQSTQNRRAMAEKVQAIIDRAAEDEYRQPDILVYHNGLKVYDNTGPKLLNHLYTMSEIKGWKTDKLKGNDRTAY